MTQYSADKIERIKQSLKETQDVLKKLYRHNPEFQDNELIEILQKHTVTLETMLADCEPVQIARPGDYAAVYAEENGIDYSTALALCNMD